MSNLPSAKLRPCDPSSSPNSKDKKEKLPRRKKAKRARWARKPKKVKTPLLPKPKLPTPAPVPASAPAPSPAPPPFPPAATDHPLKGTSKLINGEQVGYLVIHREHEVRIFSRTCEILATARRNRAFEEALSSVETHTSFAILRFQGLA